MVRVLVPALCSLLASTTLWSCSSEGEKTTIAQATEDDGLSAGGSGSSGTTGSGTAGTASGNTPPTAADLAAITGQRDDSDSESSTSSSGTDTGSSNAAAPSSTEEDPQDEAPAAAAGGGFGGGGFGGGGFGGQQEPEDLTASADNGANCPAELPDNEAMTSCNTLDECVYGTRNCECFDLASGGYWVCDEGSAGGGGGGFGGGGGGGAQQPAGGDEPAGDAGTAADSSPSDQNVDDFSPAAENPEVCPEDFPHEASVGCDTLQSCAYGNATCLCSGVDDDDNTIWECEIPIDPFAPAADNPGVCPDTLPGPDTACDTLQSCNYGPSACSCAAGDEGTTWNCSDADEPSNGAPGDGDPLPDPGADDPSGGGAGGAAGSDAGAN